MQGKDRRWGWWFIRREGKKEIYLIRADDKCTNQNSLHDVLLTLWVREDVMHVTKGDSSGTFNDSRLFRMKLHPVLCELLVFTLPVPRPPQLSQVKWISITAFAALSIFSASQSAISD